jgi:hypothetical protein
MRLSGLVSPIVLCLAVSAAEAQQLSNKHPLNVSGRAHVLIKNDVNALGVAVSLQATIREANKTMRALVAENEYASRCEGWWRNDIEVRLREPSFAAAQKGLQLRVIVRVRECFVHTLRTSFRLTIPLKLSADGSSLKIVRDELTVEPLGGVTRFVQKWLPDVKTRIDEAFRRPVDTFLDEKNEKLASLVPAVLRQGGITNVKSENARLGYRNGALWIQARVTGSLSAR